jgi:N-acylneuraminate cytidylyltransferase
MIDGRRIIGIVPARAGSTRLPGKNIKPLAGKPLIGWTLEAARRSAMIDQVLVTSDDPAVLALAEAAGATPVSRPRDLASADSSVIDAMEHALETNGAAWDYVVLLQPTSPLRTTADIDAAIRLCHDRSAPAVISVSPVWKPASFHGAVDGEGRFTPGGLAEGAVVINGAVYVGRPERLFADRTFQVSGALAYAMPPEAGWDIDTAADFAVCEALMALR